MAAKPSKKKVIEALTEYQRLAAEVAQAEAEFQTTVAPAKARFDNACAEPLRVLEAARKERQPQMKKLAELIEAELLLGVAGDGSAALPEVAVPGAIAKVAQQTTRTIEPQAFIEATPPKARDAKWYECVSVLITKVDKHFGTKFESLIQTVSKPRVTINLTKVTDAEV